MDNKKILPFIVVLISFILLILGLFLLKNKSENKIVYIDDYFGYEMHNGIPIDKILNKKNYDKIGINPENYINFYKFLEDLKDFDGIDFDPVEENFAISQELDSGKTRFIPFKFMRDHEIFDDEVYKNLAILDIYQAYKDGYIYGGNNSSSAVKIFFDEDFHHPLTQELRKIFAVDLFDQSNNVNNYISKLEQVGGDSKRELELLAYLYEFTGEYDKANNLRDNSIDYLKLTVEGNVFDSDGYFLTGVDLELLNNGEKLYYTDNGKFEFDLEVNPFSHLRFKATKNGYSDGFVTVSLNQYDSFIDNKKITINFTLHKADEVILINESNFEDYELAKFYIVEMKGSKYFIPFDGLYYNDLSQYSGRDITVYLYQFNRDTNLENLLDNDTFEPIYGYVGNTMVTFGMPYIQIIDNLTGKELFTRSTNPVILQNRIFHMEELYNDEDGLYGAITDDDMDLLFSISEELGGYPIDFEFLTSSGFLRWPARWTLDRTKGIWRSVGHRVIDKAGVIEVPFFHVD